MIPYYLLRPGFPSMDLVFRIDILTNLLFLGCVASMLCYLAWNWVIKKLGSAIVTNYVYFNPVTTVIFAWLILSERITLYFLLGTLLILTGMYLCNKITSKQKRQPESSNCL
jgi:drug/metabolite transporter (DMT)-like permease